MAAKHYDFLIIGGGIVGCAIAWQLRRLAPQKSVALIEKNSIGSGSTSRSAAAFRHQFSSRGNILLSQIAYETYSELGALFGIEDGGFREHGYLLVYTNPDAFATAEQRARRQARAGVPVEVLSPKAVDELPRVKGFFDTDALCGATWCARDGFLDPLLAAQTFFQGARALGAELITAKVERLIRQQDQVIGVETKAGPLHCEVLINATGWLSNSLLDPEGLSLPIMPVKRYLYITTPVRERDISGLPMVVCDLEPYMRPESGNALLMGWDALPRVPSSAALEAHYDYQALEAQQDIVDPEFTNDEYGLEVRVRMAEVAPLLGSDQLRLFQEACGYYQITADEKPILDWDPRAPGLLHATGFSGHGIMHAPSAGLYIAGLALGRETISGLEPGTFGLPSLLAQQPRPDEEHMSI